MACKQDHDFSLTICILWLVSKHTSYWTEILMFWNWGRKCCNHLSPLNCYMFPKLWYVSQNCKHSKGLQFNKVNAISLKDILFIIGIWDRCHHVLRSCGGYYMRRKESIFHSNFKQSVRTYSLIRSSWMSRCKENLHNGTGILLH